MAVMQTPHGRVIGLILPKEDQPMKEAVEKKPEIESEAAAKPETGKRNGRTAKK